MARIWIPTRGRSGGDVQPVRVKIDSGGRTSGDAIISNGDRKVFSCKFLLRPGGWRPALPSPVKAARLPRGRLG
jgi:hypothetical protein